jgi:hypothetical protein
VLEALRTETVPNFDSGRQAIRSFVSFLRNKTTRWVCEVRQSDCLLCADVTWSRRSALEGAESRGFP